MHLYNSFFFKLKFFISFYFLHISYMDHTHMSLFIVHIIKTVYSYFKMLMLNVYSYDVRTTLYVFWMLNLCFFFIIHLVFQEYFLNRRYDLLTTHVTCMMKLTTPMKIIFLTFSGILKNTLNHYNKCIIFYNFLVFNNF